VPRTWLEDAARRAGQIQAVTHALKPTHPDARGTNLYCQPDSLPRLRELGSHALGQDFDGDVVGNAAALDVYKFLKLEHEGQTLLASMLAGDANVAAALSDDPAEAATWIEAFTQLTQPRGRPGSHTLAKQLYWLTGEDPLNDADYHLLAPLYATSLAHRVFERVQDDRFGEAAKAARAARKAGEFHDRPTRDYPDLAVQKLGGTKPQNISQLNSERLGQNFLLASLPPQWHSRDVTPLLHADSMFGRFGRRPEVRRALRALQGFLATDPPRSVDTRDQRDDLAEDLLDEFLHFGALMRELPPGWSDDPACRLQACEKVWLDVGAAATRATDWADELARRYANWLNGALGTTEALRMGDPEQAHWRKALAEALADFDWELNHAD
jgi:CRISPR-associated protein Csy1